MKKNIKKVMAVGLTLTTVMSLVGCGSTASNSSTQANTGSTEIQKPETFTVMVNGSVLTEDKGGKAFYEQLNEATGLNVQWIRPDHSGYYDAVGNAFNSEDTMPDVIRLDADYYSLYAANGFLWDMTDAWENSETKNSGRLISTADSVIESMKVNGEDGQPALYGIAPTRGNGTITYIKETWLEAIGMSRADVENKTLTFDEYYNMLKKMREVTGKSVISCAGFINTETPYQQYLPEFYQQAKYSFYQDASGKYVDGFTEQAMKDALARIRQGVVDGVIDQESVNNSTANARDKFYADETGVFTYWAGTWAYTLETQLAAKGQDDRLVPIAPIKELGKYIERISQAWCITTAAENPEGIFKYFIDKMLDGGECQTLWEYGAKGTHWDTKAETVTLEGKEDQAKTYKEGEFHLLPAVDNPTTLATKNCFDPMLVIGSFPNGDPGDVTLSDTAKNCMNFFAENSQILNSVPMTEAYGDNISDINKQRNIVITGVAMGTMTVDEGMAEYTAKVGPQVEEILKSINK